MNKLGAKGLTPKQQDAALARRNFIAVAPLFLMEVHAAMQRRDSCARRAAPLPRALLLNLLLESVH